jgi:hypothetical protein
VSGSSADEPRFQISTGDDPDDLRSLMAWLRQEDELRKRLSFEPGFRPSGGEMGGVVDMLTIALGSGGAGAVLAGSLSTWLANRSADIELTLTGRDGRKLVLNAHRVRDVPELLREMERLIQPPDQPG